MGIIGALLSSFVRMERRLRGEAGPGVRGAEEADDVSVPAGVAAGEQLRERMVGASLVVSVGVLIVGGASTFLLGTVPLLVVLYSCSPLAVSAVVYADHHGVRESLAASCPSSTLVQLTWLLGAAGTYFTWYVPDPALVLSTSLTFPLVLWAWLLETGMGLATPLRLPGTFAALTLGLAKRLAAQSSSLWWFAPCAAFFLVLLLWIIYLTVVHRRVIDLTPISTSTDSAGIPTHVDVAIDDYQPLAAGSAE